MNELYAESGVKKKDTAVTYLIRFILIFGSVASFMLTFSSPFLIIISVAFITGVIFYFPRLSVEYEYVFCDGQLDFDKIMGNAKRKTALKIDMDQVQVVAPMGSHELDSFNHIQNLKVKNFSSGNNNAKQYVIIGQAGEQMVKIIFEPSEKMINCMRQKSPRKVIIY